MATTYVPASAPLGSHQASIIYSKALLARMVTQRTFKTKITGPMDLDSWMKGLSQSETSRGYPIVHQMDLMKNSGDQITCDIVNRIGGKPVMGDKIAGDKGVPIDIGRDAVLINQHRKVIDAGGRMSQQRTPHDFRKLGLSLSVDYLNYLEDNLAQVHLAGARGYATGIEWKMPLAADPEFVEIAVNPVLPPSGSRYVGISASNTSIANLATTNFLTLAFFDDLRTINDTSPVPLQGVQLQGMDGSVIEGEDSSMLICFISSEQWNGLLKQTSGQNWRQFIADATSRLAQSRHPLFKNGQTGLWRDILICQAPRPIEFPAGSDVEEYDAAGVLQTVQANVRAHRGILLGAQAMSCAYGNAKRWEGASNSYAATGGGQTKMNQPYVWVEELSDGGNLLKLYTGFMGGYKKLRYTFENTLYDNGVFAFDSYVAPLR